MSALFAELLRAGVYKKSQGRIARQVTFAALAVTVLLGLWRLSSTLYTAYPNGVYLFGRDWLPVPPKALYYAMPAVLLAAGWWICYRAVNLPGFADFLISVEAEMNKVSWPSRGELFRASLVVLLTILFLGFILAAMDLVWIKVFWILGV
ncbi:MAG: preprotein translocase subunit SecE [Thermoguttaceae bacterium]